MSDHAPATDPLLSLREIAALLGLKVRRCYYLAARNELPTFKLGGLVYARRSTLLAFIAEREAAALSGRSTATAA